MTADIFDMAHARARSRALRGSGSKSSAETTPPLNSRNFLMVDQSGRTIRRRMRETVTRETLIAEATSSSDSPLDSMNSERCAIPVLYTQRTIEVKAKCTPSVVYEDKGAVHDVYMPATQRKKAQKPERTKYDPCHLRAWREHKGLSQHQLSAKIGEYLAEHKIAVGHSYSIIGRIERGLTPYNQAILQAAAHVLNTNVKALLFVDPDQAQLVEMADQLVRQVHQINTPLPAIPGSKAKRA